MLPMTGVEDLVSILMRTTHRYRYNNSGKFLPGKAGITLQGAKKQKILGLCAGAALPSCALNIYPY